MSIYNRIIRAIGIHGAPAPLQTIADRTNTTPENTSEHLDYLTRTGHVAGVGASAGVPPSTFELTDLGRRHADNDDGTDSFLNSALLVDAAESLPTDEIRDSGEETMSQEREPYAGEGGTFGGGGAGGPIDDPDTSSDGGSSAPDESESATSESATSDATTSDSGSSDSSLSE